MRDLFSTPIEPTNGEPADSIQRDICDFVRAEDPSAPLSDEKLRYALESAGIRLSRCSIANHREAAGISSVFLRRKR